MGLFCLPEDLKDPTAMQLVDAAINNLKLWKQNPDCDYLIFTFAIPYLNDAMRKLRPIDVRVDQD